VYKDTEGIGALYISLSALSMSLRIAFYPFLLFLQKRDVFGHSVGSNSRRVLQRLRLHRPTLSTQKQQQGIPISLEMGTLDYESYPLDPSGPVDFFSDPMLLDGGLCFKMSTEKLA